MIVIEKPYVKELKDKAQLICNIKENEQNKEVYLEVDKEYKKYLCYERGDAFLIAIFFYAMRENQNIICKSLISEDLYYQITEYLIPLFQKHSHGKLKSINISCETANNIENIGAVGTGLTCGVDSFYSIYNNIDNKLKTRKLTHLTIMSLASSYRKGGNYQRISNDLYTKAENVAEELNLPLIKIKSNMRDLFPIPPMHTLIRMYGVYALQKLFGVYYFSSGYPIGTFNLEDCSLIDSARYDLLLCKELTTKNLFIYSDGSQINRLEKLKALANNKIVQKNLHVCIADSTNCGRCSKCIRTIVALDSINQLDNFKDVFDVDYYKKNKDDYFEEIVNSYKSGDLFIFDFIDNLIEKYKNNKILKKLDNTNTTRCNRCYRLSDYNIYKKSEEKEIIGVIGSSSSGKSTVAEILNEKLPNSKIIKVDNYMIKYLDVYKQEIIKKLNIPTDQKHWCNYIYNNCEEIKKWISILKKDIEECIHQEIIKSNEKIIIIDSFMLPELDVFQKCKYKILVQSNINLKLKRIKIRLAENGRLKLFNDQSLKNRIKYTEINKETKNFDFILKNNTTKNQLLADTIKIIEKIK